MAATVDIPFPDVHPRIGARVLEADPGVYPIRPSERFAPSTFAALVYWDRAAIGGWLTVQAEAVGGSSVVPFGSTPTDLQNAVVKHRAEATPLAQQVATDEWVRANHFLVGSVTAPAGVRLRFAVDTGHEGFVKFVGDEPPPDGKTVELTVLYFDGSAGQPDAQLVRLILTPATPVRAARALLALDLGNTTTTAALLDPYERDGDPTRPLTRRIPLLFTTQVRAGNRAWVVGISAPHGRSIASELRFDKFRTWPAAGTAVPPVRRFPDYETFPDDDRPNAVDWVAGDLARAGGPARSQVLGAKRMGSSRPLPKKPGERYVRFATHAVSAAHRVVPEEGEPTESPNATVQVDVRTPLELLACRVLQHFREDQRAWPAKIALTYPNTYSRFELQSLRRAVQKAWLRMQAKRQVPEHDADPHDRDLNDAVRQMQAVVNGPLDLDTQARDPVIQLLLDEASAAAFFHLYRRIFETIDGGLAAFRYLHPHGLNVLLYDCGGGTTDIALVRAVVEPDDRTLRITVLRRSGVRTFGGDDITRQVCRLLKAKIAAVLSAERLKRPGAPPPNVPAKPPADAAGWAKLAADLERFISDVAAADPQDQLVPTKTPPGQPASEDRRAAALALWRLGEQVKHQLSADKPPPGVAPAMFQPGEARLPPMERDTNALTRAILAGEAQQTAAVKKKLEAVSVTRTEIDALVREPLLKSIGNCNKLIAAVFGTPATDDPPDEVHWVVASGNAVRYPLFQQMLRKNLDVAFLDDDRFHFDEENAKEATAKGAVLALAAMEARGEQIDPKFDSDLADRLPFDVGYRDLRVNRVKVLFEEHTRYLELKQRAATTVPVAGVSKDGVPATQFLLQRRFPGDDAFHSFLVFKFPDGIKGAHLTVAYDDQSEFEFRVTDEAGTDGEPEDLTAAQTNVYVAPAQRGDI